MDIVSVAAVAVASLSTLLLVVALVQLRSLRRDVAGLAPKPARAAPSTGRDDQLLLVIRDQVRDLEAQIAQLKDYFAARKAVQAAGGPQDAKMLASLNGKSKEIQAFKSRCVRHESTPP